MKKVCIALAAVLLVAAFVTTILSARSHNAMDDFFRANVEALTTSESVATKTCYTKSYSIIQASEIAIFCDEQTSVNEIYSCPSENYGRKGSTDRCLK